MSSRADTHEAVFPYIHHLTFATPYTPIIFTATLLSTLLALPLLPLIPLRPFFLMAGLAPFALSHPLVQRTFTQLLSSLPLSRWRARLTRLIDDDMLKDLHWQSELREVEIFENERWAPGEGIEWNKTNLKSGERVAWTRGRDGWSGVTVDGGGDVRSVVRSFPSRPPRSAHAVTAAISRSCWSLAGCSSRPKTGGQTLKPSGAKSARMIVSILFCHIYCAVSLMSSVTPQRGGSIQMMHGSSHTHRQWVNGRLKVR